MSHTLSVLKRNVISILPFLARRHPDWCDRTHRPSDQLHSGEMLTGFSPTLNSEGQSVTSWHVGAMGSPEWSSPLVFGGLHLRSDNPNVPHGITVLGMVAADARAFAHDLLRVADLIEATA